MPKPLCFMIMPYGRKPTQTEVGRGSAEIDFNALWDRGYVPVTKELGYEPVRADQDTGALIISQMLERLYFADLVLADIRRLPTAMCTTKLESDTQRRRKAACCSRLIGPVSSSI